MQQLLCHPTITCIWYSNLPSSHLASIQNVLCLQLCQFMFHLSLAILPCLRSFIFGVLRNPWMVCEQGLPLNWRQSCQSLEVQIHCLMWLQKIHYHVNGKHGIPNCYRSVISSVNHILRIISYYPWLWFWACHFQSIDYHSALEPTKSPRSFSPESVYNCRYVLIWAGGYTFGS